TVQAEGKTLANRLFQRLVGERRSFVWDSSMSDVAETTGRLTTLRDAGYQLELVAVFTPLESAIRFAMSRAKLTRRFSNPVALPISHQDFLGAFESYLDFFRTIRVFHNKASVESASPEDAILIAERAEPNKGLVIFDRTTFHNFVQFS